MPTLLTPHQVAAHLQIPLVTIQRWCRLSLRAISQGRVPVLPGVIQVGRSWGIPLEAVKVFKDRLAVRRKAHPGNPKFGKEWWDEERRKKAAEKRNKELER